MSGAALLRLSCPDCRRPLPPVPAAAGLRWNSYRASYGLPPLEYRPTCDDCHAQTCGDMDAAHLAGLDS